MLIAKAFGANTNITPIVVATPLPPLKPSHGIKIWPSTEPNPTKTGIRVNSLAKNAGRKPFAMSSIKTGMANQIPNVLKTLVNPIFLLPVVLMSIFLIRAMIKPKGILPMIKPIIKDTK
jgi:hypothetical protein